MLLTNQGTEGITDPTSMQNQLNRPVNLTSQPCSSCRPYWTKTFELAQISVVGSDENVSAGTDLKMSARRALISGVRGSAGSESSGRAHRRGPREKVVLLI